MGHRRAYDVCRRAARTGRDPFQDEVVELLGQQEIAELPLGMQGMNLFNAPFASLDEVFPELGRDLDRPFFVGAAYPCLDGLAQLGVQLLLGPELPTIDIQRTVDHDGPGGWVVLFHIAANLRIDCGRKIDVDRPGWPPPVRVEMHGRKDAPVCGRVFSRHGSLISAQLNPRNTPYLAACWRFLRIRALPVCMAATRASRSPFSIARASAASPCPRVTAADRDGQ